MNQFFEMSAAEEDGSGMMIQFDETNGAGLGDLWASRKYHGGFNMDIFPWKEAEARALKRRARLKVVQRHDPTDFIDPDPQNVNSQFYVNKKVILAMDAAGLDGWTAHAIHCEVVNGSGHVLRHEVFFSIIPLGEAPQCTLEKWEPIARPLRNVAQLASAGYQRLLEQTPSVPKERWQIPIIRTVPNPETWDKNDIMFGPVGDSFKGSFWCSRKVLELAHREQWTNAAFQPVDLLVHNHTDFRLRCWPPEKWYPKWHPSFQADLHEGENLAPKTPAEEQKELEAKPPSWTTASELYGFSSSAVLAYVKKNAKILGECSKAETAHFAAGLNGFDDICSFLDLLGPGPAEEGFLIILLDDPTDDAKMAVWFKALSPARKLKVQNIIKDPPDDLILSATDGDHFSSGSYRRSLAKIFGLKMDIPDRPDYD